MVDPDTVAFQAAEPLSGSVAPAVQSGDLLGMLVSTIIVVAAIVILGWAYSRSKFVKSGASDVIDIVAMRALGPKERLLVVDVAEQQLLIGITAGAVQTLHVFENPVVASTTRNSDSPSVTGFANKLRSLMQDRQS